MISLRWLYASISYPRYDWKFYNLLCDCKMMYTLAIFRGTWCYDNIHYIWAEKHNFCSYLFPFFLSFLINLCDNQIFLYLSFYDFYFLVALLLIILSCRGGKPSANSILFLMKLRVLWKMRKVTPSKISQNLTTYFYHAPSSSIFIYEFRGVLVADLAVGANLPGLL